MSIPSRNYWQSGKKLTVERYLRMQYVLRKSRTEAVIFCEHPPSITAGIQSKPQNLLIDKQSLADQGIRYVPVDRGGDHTSHEPGQLIVYIHIDLKKRNIKISRLIQSVVESSQKATELTWGIKSEYNSEYPGLYAGTDLKKLSAIGLMVRNDFSSFGLSVNIHNDLSTFNHIIPCGTPVGTPVSVSRLLKEEDTEALRHSVTHFENHWLSEFKTKILQSQNTEKS
jgi:lipoyl(octanoyl) transferase